MKWDVFLMKWNMCAVFELHYQESTQVDNFEVKDVKSRSHVPSKSF